MTAFDKALAQVLKWEGGFVEHPADAGGATAFGITTATYDAYRRKLGLDVRPVREIDRTEVEAIYWGSYWLRAGCDQLQPPALALVVLDASVNSGVGAALKWLSQTRDWREYNALRLEFLTGLDTWGAFGKGWTRRVADLTRAAAELERGTTVGTAERVLVVFDAEQRQVASVPLGDSDLLVRVRGSRVYVRPDK